MVAFTGSTEVGKFFLRYAGESNMKRVALECGGKSPHIVMPDCGDLDAAAAAAWGIFFNQGEVCNAGSRLIVHESLKDDLLERINRVADGISRATRSTQKTRMGPLVDSTQLDRVLDYIESGRDEGADLYRGGTPRTGGVRRLRRADDLRRCPERHAHRARGDFRAVLSAITFTEEDEAIRIANDTMYGLAAGIWTKTTSTGHTAPPARSRRAWSG